MHRRLRGADAFSQSNRWPSKLYALSDGAPDRVHRRVVENELRNRRHFGREEDVCQPGRQDRDAIEVSVGIRVQTGPLRNLTSCNTTMSPTEYSGFSPPDEFVTSMQLVHVYRGEELVTYYQ